MLRKHPIITGQIYHIYNRGVNKGKIFFNEGDYEHFLLTMKHYKTKESKLSLKPVISDPVSE